MAWEKEKAWGFTVLESNVRIFKSLVEVVELEEVGEGQTKLTYFAGFEMKGMARLIGWAIRGQFTKTWRKAFLDLEKYLAD
ncbi:MAG: hypothetical protein AAF570_19295 [Bacteroidota bacterium]